MRKVARSLALGVTVAALSVVLTSCLGVEVSTRFNEDGSGTMTMRLRISQMFLQMGQEGEAPVPLTKEDVEAAYKGLEGVSVENVAQENTDQDRIITSTVTFKNYTVFNDAKDLAGAGATLRKEDGRTIYRVVIGETAPTPSPAPAVEGSSANDAPSGDAGTGAVKAEEGGSAADAVSGQDATDEAMQAMLKSLVAGYSVSYTVTAPSRIISHTVGELSPDGKSVRYSITMSDYMNLKQPVMFEVKW